MASSTPPPSLSASTGHNGKIKSQAFEDAYRCFFESLSPKEQLLYSPCASHDDFIDAMRKLEEVANKRRKRGSSRFLDRIARLSDRLQPFFGVVNIMIQSNPEYTALAWGALRFILQLASGFSTFFEKLIATLERFCDEIPRYEDIHSMVSQEGRISDRIKECTEKVYGHMFQFFREIANVFTSGGRIKRTPVVIADILWRPFENRFDSLLEQIQSCRSLIEFDILLLQARVAKDTNAIALAQKEIAKKEQFQNWIAQKKADELAKMTSGMMGIVFQTQREQHVERIQKWLSPSQYADALFHGKSLREPGTNEWILTNPQFCEWRAREWAIRLSGQQGRAGLNVLWIKGNPGSGKSVLASSVIGELTAACRQDRQRWELCYFFFTPDCKGRISAYRAILSQIFHRNRQDNETINTFDFTMTDPSSSGTPQAGLDELFGLVKLLFPRFQIFLILDGIDECEDNSSLMEEILELSESSSAKIILCGRANTESLIRTIPTSSQICLDRDIVNPDIRLFTSTQVDLLLDGELLPLGSDSEDLVNHLCGGADGMFLWAKLMFKYLGLPVHNPYSRLEIIRSILFPEGLEEMYARIVHTISQAGQTWRDFASRVLAWASYSLHPLTLEELYNQMTFDTPKTNNVAPDQLKVFREQVSIVCGGLIEFREVPSRPTPHGVLRYIHVSVKDHFSQKGPELGSQVLFLSPEAIAHLTCARKCIGYLMYHAPTRKEQLGCPEPTDPTLGAFAPYAANYWAMHLDLSFTSASANTSDFSSALMKLAPNLLGFLHDSTKVKFWIHVLYNHSNPCMPDSVSRSLDELALTLSGPHCFLASMENLSKTLQQFCKDVSKALNAWDNHLRRSTDILWDEITIFSESPFMAGPAKGQVISMAPTPSHGIICPNSSLICKISRTSVDGGMTAVVSRWQCPRSLTHSVVKYELWKHNTVPTRLSEIINPMERIPTGDIHPISISDDLGSFAIMQRLFVLIPNGNEPPAFTHSTIIPIPHGKSSPDPRSTFFKLSAQGRFLLSSDSAIGDASSITIFEVENNGPLQVKVIMHKDFPSRYFPSLSEAIFHPSHQVVIIRGGATIALWKFGKEDGNEPEGSFEILHSCLRIGKMDLSSCGKFIALMTDGVPPTILSIPEPFLTPGLSSFNKPISIPRSDWKLDKAATKSLLTPIQGDSALQLNPGLPVHRAQIHTLANGLPGQLISVQGGEGISITRNVLQSMSTDEETGITRTALHSKRTDEEINIIRLPQGEGLNGATPTILAPAPGDESIRVILDENGRGGQQQPNNLPIFISRDINAIKHTFYDGAGGRSTSRQQIRNREEPESEQVTKRRRIGAA